MVHGYHWISIDIHVCPRISMDILGHALPLIDIGCPPISMDIYGHPLISIYIRGRGVFGHTVLEREGLRGFCFPVCHPRQLTLRPRGGEEQNPQGPKDAHLNFRFRTPKGGAEMQGRDRSLYFGSCFRGPGPKGGPGHGGRIIWGVKGRRFSKNLLASWRCLRVLRGSATDPEAPL